MIRPAARALCCVCLLASLHANGQQLDEAIFSQGSKATTILDQIENREERKAFLKLYKERDAAKRRTLAEKFVVDYPASWLLAQVYEAAAEACIDLNDSECGLKMGAQSLRLLPENPLLLVRLATVQVQRGLLAHAQESASGAIELLDRFAAPAGTRPDQWSKLSRDLRASSNYALGQIYATKGLKATGSERTRLLELSLDALRSASSPDPQNPESAYLRGLVSTALGRFPEAAADFRVAALCSCALKERAQQQLEKLSTVAATRQAPAVPPAAVKQQPPPGALEYAGSDVCRSCHTAEFDAWQRTGMAKMLRPYRPENIIGDFTTRNRFEDGVAQVRMKVDRDRHVFEIRGEHGVWNRYPVHYTIGSKWQQAYATQLPDGRVQVFPIQYNVLKHEWINYWRIIDPPGSERADAAGFARMPAAANFQKNCAPCHTSQLHSDGIDDAKLVHATFREGGINCEMCHRPSASHVREKKEGAPAGKQPVDFTKISNRESVAICAQCHMQSAVRDPADQDGEFPPHYRQRPYTEFLRRAFYKDGRLRETTFIVEAFMRSACFRKGTAQCASCHNPHLLGQPGNETSFKFASNPDEMCLQCHGQYRKDVERHTHHQAVSEGSRCQSCHMPRMMNSVMFLARSHQIDDKPNPEAALRFGLTDSPLACLECHAKKDALWVQSALRSWGDISR